MKFIRVSDYTIAKFIKASIDMVLFVKGNGFNPEPLLPENILTHIHKAGYGYLEYEEFIDDWGTSVLVEGIFVCRPRAPLSTAC